MAAKKDTNMTQLNAQIPTDIHKRLRVEAINRDARVQDLVATALRRFLGMPEPEQMKPPKKPAK